MKMLLHACCAPCSLEPTRILLEHGTDITVYFSNSNIAPKAEYDKRLAELRTFASDIGLRLIEGEFDPDAWENTAGVIGEGLAAECNINDFSRDVETVAELLDDEHRQERCRACYRQRLEESARAAVDGGFDTLSTTLAVSPYQFTEVIREELDRVCAHYGLTPYFEDWRPFYDNATARSREMGMYRQNYCGCRFSIAEGRATREFIKHRNAQKKAQERAAHADEIAAAEAKRKERAAERSAYNKKQERKRAVLKALREQRNASSEEYTNHKETNRENQ